MSKKYSTLLNTDQQNFALEISYLEQCDWSRITQLLQSHRSRSEISIFSKHYRESFTSLLLQDEDKETMNFTAREQGTRTWTLSLRGARYNFAMPSVRVEWRSICPTFARMDRPTAPCKRVKRDRRYRDGLKYGSHVL